MFREKMKTPAIPERVYTLCKIVEKKPLTVQELKNKMELDYLQQSTSYFADYREAAEELGLISVTDQNVELAASPSAVRSMADMRRYVNGRLEEFADGQFYRVTKAYYARGANVLHGEQNVANLAPSLEEEVGRPLDAKAMRAWRFWIVYLGFGYLHGMFLVPNADVFLHDLMDGTDFEKHHTYSFGEFIEKILPRAGIVIDADPSNRQLSYGVSNGLRTLHDAGVIRMEHILDQQDIWSLYPLKAHDVETTVTNVTILE